MRHLSRPLRVLTSIGVALFLAGGLLHITADQRLSPGEYNTTFAPGFTIDTAARLLINARTGTLYEINKDTSRVIIQRADETIMRYAVSDIGDAALNEQTNTLYIVSDKATLVFNGDTGKQIGQFSLTGSLAVNVHNNRVLVSDSTGVSIMNGQTYQLLHHIPYVISVTTPSPDGRVPDWNTYAIGVTNNAVSDDYFIQVSGPACGHGGCWRDTGLEVFDSTTYQPKAGSFGYSGAVIDPTTGRVFWSGWLGGDVPRRETDLYSDVIHLDEPVKRFDFIAGELSVDYAEQQLFIATEEHFLIVIDLAHNMVTATYPLNSYHVVGFDNGHHMLIVEQTEQTNGQPLRRLYRIPYAQLAEFLPPVVYHPDTAQPLSGYLWSLDFSPDYAQDHLMYVRSGTAIYQSRDSGESWARLWSGEQGCICSLAFSPDFRHDHTAFLELQTADPDYSAGLLKTTDSDQTWQTDVMGLPSLDVYDLNFSPNWIVDHTLLATVVYDNKTVSFDGGNTWHTPTPDKLTAIAALPTPITSPDPEVIIETDTYKQFKSPAFATDRTYFKITHNDTNSSSLLSTAFYKSTDGGKTWRRLDTPNVEK